MILHELADELGWEFVRDAARWVYDESRHMLMGKRRLDAWGLDPAATPLGGYIYEACTGQDPIYRLGMLGYFETKNIGRKRERAQAFAAMDSLLTGHMIDVLLYNSQATSPITERLRAVASQNGIPVVPVTETLPPGATFQTWQLGRCDGAHEAEQCNREKAAERSSVRG